MGKSKRFTLKRRLPIYFGLLSIFSICVISFISVNQASAVLASQIRTNLTTIVEDQAKIFFGKVHCNASFKYRNACALRYNLS